MTTGDIDPAVLASLPPSMQLDLLVQMRERVMAENRQKYQKIKKVIDIILWIISMVQHITNVTISY
jgi:hypothetical protein